MPTPKPTSWQRKKQRKARRPTITEPCRCESPVYYHTEHREDICSKCGRAKRVSIDLDDFHIEQL